MGSWADAHTCAHADARVRLSARERLHHTYVRTIDMIEMHTVKLTIAGAYAFVCMYCQYVHMKLNACMGKPKYRYYYIESVLRTYQSTKYIAYEKFMRRHLRTSVVRADRNMIERRSDAIDMLNRADNTASVRARALVSRLSGAQSHAPAYTHHSVADSDRSRTSFT